MSASAPVSPEQEALLANVIARPDDDLPRLVYSDWLKEHGEETYGEFIRLQVTIASMEERTPERDRLRRQETQVWKKLATAWIDRLGPLDKRFFSRGFPLAMTDGLLVSTTCSEFRRESRVWWPLLPIRWINLIDNRLPTRRLLEIDYLPRIAGLAFIGAMMHYPPEELPVPFVEQLFESTSFHSLESLKIETFSIPRRGWEVIRTSSLVNQLKSLTLRSYGDRNDPWFNWPGGSNLNENRVAWGQLPLPAALDWFIEHFDEI